MVLGNDQHIIKDILYIMKHIDRKEDDNIDNRRRWNRNGRVRVQLKQSFRLSIYISRHIMKTIIMIITVITALIMAHITRSHEN